MPGHPIPVAVGAVDGDGPCPGNVAGTPDPSADGAVGTVPGAVPGADPAPAPGALDVGVAPPSPAGTVAVATAIGEPVGTGPEDCVALGAEELTVG